MCLSLTNLFHPSFVAKLDSAMRAASELSLESGHYGSAHVYNRKGKVVLTIWHWRGKMARNIINKVSGFTFDDNSFKDITELVKLALCIHTTDILQLEAKSNMIGLLANQWDYLDVKPQGKPISLVSNHRPYDLLAADSSDSDMILYRQQVA